MELKEFIKGVLSDVTNAIKESQEEITNGAIISPIVTGAIENISTEEGNLKISYIDFEVALTANSSNEENSGVGGGIAVFSAFVGGKTEKGEKIQNENISRIKFSIPIVYPFIVVKEKDKSIYSHTTNGF